AMSRDVAARYQTAADLAADLACFLEGRRIAAAERLVAARADLRHVLTAPRRTEWSATIVGVRALATDPTGQFVAVGLASGAIELRDAATGTSIDSLLSPRGAVISVTFAADGRLVAAWADGTVAMVTFPRSS